MRKSLLPLLFGILAFLGSCIPEKPSEYPWHGLDRSVRYHPDGEDFVIVSGQRRFNRALYGTHTGFRIEAGDLPEFALYLPGMGGNLKFGLGRKDTSLWLTDAGRIEARYRPGSMIYEIRDPILDGGRLILHLLALSDREGMILKLVPENLPEDAILFWAYGGATGKRFSRDGDIGADPESSFYLKPEYCADNEFGIEGNSFILYYGSNQYTPSGAELRGSMFRNKKCVVGLAPPGSEIRVCDANRQESPVILFGSPKKTEGVFSGKSSFPAYGDLYFILAPSQANPGSGKNEGMACENAPEWFDRAEESRSKLAGRIRVQTPDPYINPYGAALSVAADAIWEPPSFLHGAVAWRMRLPGWRGAYAGDWLGWHDRAQTHFRGYAMAQYTSPPSGPNVPDPKTNLARQQEKAGNALFSSGYISRRPERISPPHHYDMNLVYIDQFLWHFNWTGDLDFAREAWPVIKRHLAWEKRCFDADGDGLYNAYCCIWASDALQYSGGGVTHSSAYNYRGNFLAGRLAEMIGEDPAPYLEEAERIRTAVGDKLWMPGRGWYAEYKDLLGLQRVHPSAALWSIYHAVDAGLPDLFQAYQCLRYIDREIPHIPMIAEGMPDGTFYTLSTSNWMPYTWSINNVALSENLHTCLAYWQGGRPEEAFTLWKSQVMESMYMGASPGNFQQLSFYDAFRGELYRDFADPIGMAARTLVEGLFGIRPDALERTLAVCPGLPGSWDYASLETPDIAFYFSRDGDVDRYIIVPSFPMNMGLRLRVRARKTRIGSIMVNGKETPWKNIYASVGAPVIEIRSDYADTISVSIRWKGSTPDEPRVPERTASGDRLQAEFNKARLLGIHDPQHAASKPEFSGRSVSFSAVGLTGHRTVFARVEQEEMSWWVPLCFEIKPPVEFIASDSLGKNELKFKIANYRSRRLEGSLLANGHIIKELWIGGGKISGEISIPPGYLMPGSNALEFRTEDTTYHQCLVNWDIQAAPSLAFETPDLSGYFNDRLDNIFRNKYLSPRAGSPTLQIPVQGIGDWCSFNRMAHIDDSGLRARAGKDNRIVTGQGIPLRTPGEQGVPNILFTSKWDNYPDRASIPLEGKASHVYLLMAGSVHHMQSRMENGIVRILYEDGSADELRLVHPDTWWPIEQDYYLDGFAFRVDAPKPPRILLKTGQVQKQDYRVLRKNGTNDIDGGAASLYDLPLDPSKEMRELQLETLANDVVIGLMSISLVRNE